MAAAAPSPLAPSTETTNGTKLRRLLIDGGTTVLRKVFDDIYPPTKLAASLHSHNSTLDDLFAQGILSKEQWGLLFPPDGSKPNSKTFDITLLFLLLTAICHLSPPRTGWNHKPHAKNKSLAANLVRIKLFRNKLIHTPETRIDTRLFNELWKEISGVLVALSLGQAEIDRLKAERCGKEDYLEVLFKWADREKEIKSMLEEVQQGVKRVSLTQERHQLLLQDVNTALQKQQEVHHTQQEDHRVTRQAVEDTHQVVNEVLKTQQKAHGTIQEVVKSQQENRETLQEVKKTVENMTNRSNKDKENEILRKLAKINTQKVIEYHAKRYQEGTRVSLFERVEKWLDDRSSSNRVMVISGNAGMRKSVFSAVVCERMQRAGRLSGSHFCQHDKARYRNAKVMLQSLACQLSDSLPEYKNALVKILSRNLGVELNNMEVKDLFEVLFEEPLSKLNDPGKNILMVIDALDESEFRERMELLDVIANHFPELPRWIRFLITTRPEINIADSLKSFNPLQLEPNSEENQRDLRLLFEERLSDVIHHDHQEVITTNLVKKSEGLILYAYLLVLFVQENFSLLTPEQLDNTLPSGISCVYQTYFLRLEKELCKELKIKEEQFLTFLSALTAARELLPLDFVTRMMLSGTSSLADRRKVKKVISCISALLPVQDDCVHFFHKSVKDWLTDMSCYGQHDFTVDRKEGHRILSELCTDEIYDIKRKGVGSAQFSDTAKYALKHGVQHMLQLEEDIRVSEVVIKKCVVDLEIVFARLRVRNSTPAEDILWIQQQKVAHELSDDSKSMLSTLLFLLRKYSFIFANNPYIFFQTVLNEGGPLLSSMASNLLRNQYPEIPYMEFVQKQIQQGAVVVRFQCSSRVACLDVSPHKDYMVCECEDGTIKLWSLHTGKLLWKRPVMVQKLHFPQHGAYRMPPSLSVLLSFYRSVVFHPTADVVIPGVLCHAYTFDGDLQPLFPESDCRFTVCSISGDKTKMVADCPDNAKCIIMWSLENGSEIIRTTRSADALSFAWSRDGKLLAISLSTGSISIVDALNGFTTLAEVDIPVACGMIKFSSDCRSLFCKNSDIDSFVLNTRISMAELPSCTLYDCKSFVPWECESQSEAGFLLGDPIPSCFSAFEFVLNKQTILRGNPQGSSIVMLNTSELPETNRQPTVRMIGDIVFSLSGETVYVSYAPKTRVGAWGVSSGKLLALTKGMLERECFTFEDLRDLLIPLKEGVLLTTGSGTPELWNFNLSRCVRSWTNIHGISRMFPISDERVACEAKNKVIILDTTSGEIVSTFRISHNEHFVACNSKCQLLTCSSGSLQLSDGKTTLWRKINPLVRPLGRFSLSEQFIVIFQKRCLFGHPGGAYLLDAISGEPLHFLCSAFDYYDCKFISDEECVMSCRGLSGYCLLLFNVKSGDLLSVLHLDNKEDILAACPRKRLLAIDQNRSEDGFKLIEVHLPQDKDSRESKSTANTLGTEEGRENKRGIDNLEAKEQQAAGSCVELLRPLVFVVAVKLWPWTSLLVWVEPDLPL
ncbi:uncharacterized protein LOC144638080 [Oculina patagonica]